MLEILPRLTAEAGSAATWIAVFAALMVAVFVLYVGIAMHATLHARDPEQTKIRYQIFRDLLALFSFRRRR